MCGRYTLIAEQNQLDKEFQLVVSGARYARYNIAPTQSAPVIRQDENGNRSLSEMRWDLIPFWTKEKRKGRPLTIARGEEAAMKPSFRMPLRKQRCLVPHSGFYEWQELEGSTKSKRITQPYYIRHRENRILAFAGLWDRWHDGEGTVVYSFAFLTVEPNDLMRPIHDRMPVIVRPEDYGRWLDCSVQDVEHIKSIMVPFASDELIAYPVTEEINGRTDSPACIQPPA